METGINLIAKERQEQIDKHKWTLSHDRKVNVNDDLKRAALYALTCDDKYYPYTWSSNFARKVSCKFDKERLIIAGALIAAELDRIIGEEVQQQMQSNKLTP